MQYKLTLQRSQTDARDFIYKQSKTTVPDEVDLREYDSRVENQGELGSCAAESITSNYELQTKYHYAEKFVELSSLYVYYHARYFNNEVAMDSGTDLRTALKGVKSFGICKEELWPYDITKFDVQPTPECYVDGMPRTVSEYHRVFTMSGLYELVAGKQPVLIGVDVFSNFMDIDKADPNVHYPSDKDELVGAHAMLVVGYSKPKQILVAKNSFGTEWGDKGYCYIPLQYVHDYVFEKWAFTIVPQK